MALTHSTVVVVPDDGTSPVGTDEWNADHVLTGTDTRVLFNDGGVVGEDAGLTFNKTTNKLGLNSTSVEQINATPNVNNHIEYYMDTALGDVSGGAIYGLFFNVYTQSGASATNNIGAINGISGTAASYLGAGLTATTVTGANTQAYASGGGTITKAYGLFSQVLADTGSKITSAYGVNSYIYDCTTTNDYGSSYAFAATYDIRTATLSHATYAYYCNDISADVSVNPYYLWFDAPGVYRINGAGIMAYYNPTFTKYVPAATNYERVVQQWTSDVLEYGPEAGGTGVKRAMRLKGAGVGYEAYTVSTLPTSPAGSVCYVTDGDAGLACDDTVVNSGAGATKYLVWFNGTNWKVVTGAPGGSPGGADTQVQFNDGGAFGGDSGFTFNKTTNALAVGGATVTTSNPTLNLTQTWNDSGVAFTAVKLDVTKTAAAATSLLLDLQVGGSTKYSVREDGLVTGSYVTNGTNTYALGWGGGVSVGSTSSFCFTNGTNAFLTIDTFLTRGGAATVQQGDLDAAAPVAQTLRAQSVVAGTSNTAGVDWTFIGSKGTGTGAGGQIIWRTAPAGSTGSSQNALATGLTITAPAVNMQPSVVVGNQALATNATDGFLYIPTCAGTPTGTPTAHTGRVAIVFDTTNNKLYIYDGSWLGGTAPGAFT
jgi:hypothetical protein